ncbi:unnamed protein product [Eruca vesicaria subsp. sativa]|uniref:Legume lectin domain-containing protein n=1 Tax=Eruca vesicaria subsp. sativa TaxID=29727 RepID=A0ABC8M1C3_ERUVS|nr:unnamed protein product [Eruca vesicaria subsp. sativa]
MLNVSLAPVEVKKPSLPLLSQPINLSDIFPNRSKLFVGFSAATGNAVSDHYILWWSFRTRKGESSLKRLEISKLPQVPCPKPLPTVHPKARHKMLPTWIYCSGVYFHRRKKFSEVSETWEKEFDAHRFSYKSLYKATKGFSKDEFLGKGGFDMEPLRTYYMQSEEHESNNQPVVYIGVDNTLAAVIRFEDKIREDAAQVIENLTRQGIDVYMLSGDKKSAANYVASVVGIPQERVCSSLPAIPLTP